MEQQVAVQTFDLTKLGNVAAGASHGGEGCLARSQRILLVGTRRRPFDGTRKAAHIGREGRAFLGCQVGARALITGCLGNDRLRMPGHFQPKLDGARVEHEIVDTGRLPFPAETTNPAVLQAADSALDLGSVFGLPSRNRQDGVVGNGIDQS